MRNKIIFSVFCFCFCSLFFLSDEKSEPLSKREQVSLLVKELPLRELFSTLSLSEGVLSIQYTTDQPTLSPNEHTFELHATVETLKGNLALFSIISEEIHTVKITFDDVSIEANRQEMERELTSVFTNLPTEKEMKKQEVLTAFIAENHAAILRLVKTWNGFVTVDHAASTSI